MTSQTIMLNFKDLKNLSTEEITEIVSPQTAVAVSLKSINDCEVSELEIYKTWSNSLFQSYGPSLLTDNDLRQLFDIFSVAIKELLNECETCQTDEQIEKLNEFLNYSLKLFQWIHSSAGEFESNKISMFLTFGLFSIHSFLVVLSKQISRDGTIKLIEKSLQMHTVILGILNSHPDLFVFSENQSILNNLMCDLCSVGEITPQLDIKSAVETWKCVTKVASLNVCNKQNEVNIAANGAVWLTRPMSFLIQEIRRNVQTVYNQYSPSESIKRIEKYLKVTNFYLRLLQNFAYDFRHVSFPICEEFIAALAVVFNPPQYIAKSPIFNTIMNDIGDGMKELLPYAYRHEAFFEQLLSEHTGNVHSQEAVCEVLLQIIEVIIRKNHPKYLNEKILDPLLNYASDGCLIKSKEKYSRVIELLSCLEIYFNDDQIKMKLIAAVLHDNSLHAFLAINVWCTVFKSSCESKRLSYFMFWAQLNEGFSKFSSNIAAFHTEILLRNLYALISPSERSEMWNKVIACPTRHERLFLTIGLDDIPNGPIKQFISKHFQNDLLHLLKEPNSEVTIEKYYSIIKDLQLLKSIDSKNDDLLEILFYYLEISMEDNKLYLILKTILDFININHIDGNKMQKILNTINMNISLFDQYSTKLCFIKFIQKAASFPKFEKISKEILKVLEKDEEIKCFFNLEEENAEFKTNTKEECDELWKKLIEGRSEVEIQQSQHVCRSEKLTPVAVKCNGFDTDVDFILETIESNTNKLQTQVQNSQLSIHNLEKIKNIVLKLKEISDSNV